MKIKTIYDRLKPGFKSSLQENARQYSSAKRLKYVLMSKTSWYDLTISQISDLTIFCNIKIKTIWFFLHISAMVSVFLSLFGGVNNKAKKKLEEK